MRREELVAQLEAAKALTSVVSIDNVIALIQQLEPDVIVEKQVKLTPAVSEQIAEEISRVLDYNSFDLIDLASVEFELDYDNKLSVTNASIDVDSIMTHIDSVLIRFIEDAE
jgi:hypothetical protein